MARHFLADMTKRFAQAVRACRAWCPVVPAGRVSRRHRPRQARLEWLEDRRLLCCGTLFVNGNRGWSGTGASWDLAIKSLDDALFKASSLNTDSDSTNDISSIWMTGGTYTPRVRSIREDEGTETFRMVEGVSIYGGFGGWEASLEERERGDDGRWVHETVFNGDHRHNDDQDVLFPFNDNANTVVTADGLAAPLRLDGLTIVGGLVGLTVNDAEVVLADSTVTDNVGARGGDSPWGGGGIYNQGRLTLVNTVVRGNRATRGGGIYNDSGGSVTLVNSMIVGNQAISGGGVFCDDSQLTLIGSQVSDNVAVSTDGGGILSDGETIVVNSTVSGNEATWGGGISHAAGELTIVGSVLAGNVASGSGGALRALGDKESTVSVSNTTISGNTAPEAGGVLLGSRIVNVNNSIITLNQGGDLGDLFEGPPIANATRTLVGIDPQFVRNPSPGPDGEWGTDDDDWGDLHLRATSPAIDMGRNDLALGPDGQPLAVDRDGNPRVHPAGGRVDLGAFEYQEVPAPGREPRSTTVTTSDDTFDPYDGDVSLREAVFYATSGDVVAFDARLASSTIVLDGLPLRLMESVAIRGPLEGPVTVDGNGTSSVFIVHSGATARLERLEITGGDAHYGGGIRSWGELIVSDCAIVGNSAFFDGGGIYNGGTMTLADSVIRGNSAGSSGGGIESDGWLTLTDSLVVENQGNWGGGIHIGQDGVASVVNSTVTDNQARYGGGIDSKGTVTITGSAISDNRAVWGGGLQIGGGTATLGGTAVVRNGAEHSGGLYVWKDASVTLVDTRVNENLVTVSAPGIENQGSLQGFNSQVVKNESRDWVEGISTDGGDAGLPYGRSYQTASGGGTSAIVNSGFLAFVNSQVLENIGRGEAAAIESNGTVILTNSTVAGNTAGAGSSGIMGEGDFTVHNSIITDNGDRDVNVPRGEQWHCNSSIVGIWLEGTLPGDDCMYGDPATPLDAKGSRIVQSDHLGRKYVYVLAPGSPAIDAGNDALAIDPSGEPLANDAIGRPRVSGSQVDLGAVEYSPMDFAVEDVSPKQFTFEDRQQVQLSFSRAVDEETLADVIALEGSHGPVPIQEVTLDATDPRRVVIRIDLVERVDEYRLSVAPSVQDREGTPLNQDLDSTAGESGEDGFTAVIDSFPLDTTAPGTCAAFSPLVTVDPKFTVRWNAQDDAPGSGIASYTVYVSVDGGDKAVWLNRTTGTSAEFRGEVNHSYEFSCFSRDRAGNVGPSIDADASTTYVTTRPGHNVRNWYDVTGDGAVSPIDALSIIDILNIPSAEDRDNQPIHGPPFYDVSGDNHVSPLDALQVIDAFSLGRTEPQIIITGTPNFGESGVLRGQLTGADPIFFHAFFSYYIDGLGWGKDETYPLDESGTFEISIHADEEQSQANSYCATLLPKQTRPLPTSPSILGQDTFPAHPDALATGCYERYSRTIEFAGYRWGVKSSRTLVRPGWNYFSDDPADVYVDDQGLHLTITTRDQQWRSTEVVLLDHLGYGTYTFQTESALDAPDPRIAFRAYTWDIYGDEPDGSNPNRVITIEESQQGSALQPREGYFVLPGAYHQFALPELTNDAALTRYFVWEPERVEFGAIQGHYDPGAYPEDALIDRYVYPADAHLPAAGVAPTVPTAGYESFRFSLWWFGDGKKSSSGERAELVITDFSFRELARDTTYWDSMGAEGESLDASIDLLCEDVALRWSRRNTDPLGARWPSNHALAAGTNS